VGGAGGGPSRFKYSMEERLLVIPGRRVTTVFRGRRREERKNYPTEVCYLHKIALSRGQGECWKYINEKTAKIGHVGELRGGKGEGILQMFP